MKKEIADQLLNRVVTAYDSIADDFDMTRAHPWYEFEIYRELLKKGDKILDLGCGNGRLLDFIDKREVKYTGMDVSTGLLEAAERNFDHKRTKSDYQFREGSFLDIPYKKPWFDKIISVAAFHHIPSRKYRLQALAEMKRVLRKDGTLALSVWNLWNRRYGKYILESMFKMNKYSFGDCFIPFGKEKVKRYYHAFNLGEMRSLLRDGGFYIVDEIYVTQKKRVENWFEANNFVFIAKPTHVTED